MADASLIASLPFGVLRLGPDGTIVDANPAAESLLGASAADLRGLPLSDVYQTSPMRLPMGDDEPPPSEDPADGRRATLARSDGAELSVRERTIAVEGGGSWLIVEDITEITALRREQEWLTFHDAVTGLPNRRALERQLAAALRAAERGSTGYVFAYLDVDHISEIVETFGLTAGDEVLRQVAARVRRLLGTGDFLARLGQVRFGILLEARGKGASLESRASELRTAITEAPFMWHQDAFDLGAAVGLVPIDAATAGFESVLAAADAATSMAKDESVAIHAFDADNSIDLDLADHYGDLRWLARIHRALKERRFRLFRQRIVPTSGQDSAFYEVLLRMIDEQGEIVVPGHFIPAAERFHLISSLDRWVVRNALKRMRDEPEDVVVSINLSGESLSDTRFLTDVESALAESGVEPSRLAFEITETTAVDNLRRARRFIRTLSTLGCKFVLDDFGRGLSSFAYLQNLPVEFIKIDGTFVRGMGTSEVDDAIVKAIHQVASAIGIQTIAEFVETEEIREQLAELGVDYVQGYAIGIPTPW